METTMLVSNGVRFDPERFFRVLALCEDDGTWDTASWMIDDGEARAIRATGRPDYLYRLAEWEGKVRAALEYEAVHGHQCLMKKDRPRVQRMLAFRAARDERYRRWEERNKTSGTPSFPVVCKESAVLRRHDSLLQPA